MKPPADRRLDPNGAGIDMPLRDRPHYGLQWSLVFLVATLLGILSSALAWQITRSLGRPATFLRTLIVLNCAFWYIWALFTPLIVWLSQHYRFERQGLLRAFAVHVPSVALFSCAHIAALAGVQWWLAVVEGR